MVNMSDSRSEEHGRCAPHLVSLPASSRSGATAPLGGQVKRLTDIVIAIVALALAAPLMVLVASIIRLSSPGPILLGHVRVGFGGRPFKCYKFRTMIVDAETALQAHLASDPAAAREWKESQKLRHDPRVTPVGRVLRKASLDELPQLVNVLRGDMSCVGPRPIVTEELERYGLYVDYYLRTRPGVTGLWQVTGRSNTDYDRRVDIDAQYVRDWSFWTDLTILFRTPGAVARFSHVY
jgi:exopolysaccharide production protein ExoY